MAWRTYTGVPEVVNAEDINALYDNQVILRAALVNAGHDIPVLEPVAVTASTPIADMYSIYQKLINNFNKINCASSAYTVELGDTEPDIAMWNKFIGAMNSTWALIGQGDIALYANGEPLMINDEILTVRF